MRVVDAIAQWFEVAGFKHYFGYAGGAVWPFLDALTDKPKIEGIQAKHESHAVHMADLYHRVSGRVAPVIVSKGAGPAQRGRRVRQRHAQIVAGADHRRRFDDALPRQSRDAGNLLSRL